MLRLVTDRSITHLDKMCNRKIRPVSPYIGTVKEKRRVFNAFCLHDNDNRTKRHCLFVRLCSAILFVLQDVLNVAVQQVAEGVNRLG